MRQICFVLVPSRTAEVVMIGRDINGLAAVGALQARRRITNQLWRGQVAGQWSMWRTVHAQSLGNGLPRRIG